MQIKATNQSHKAMYVLYDGYLILQGNSVGEAVEKQEILPMHCWWSCRITQLLWKADQKIKTS